jgi:hypothetical protein
MEFQSGEIERGWLLLVVPAKEKLREGVLRRGVNTHRKVPSYTPHMQSEDTKELSDSELYAGRGRRLLVKRVEGLSVFEMLTATILGSLIWRLERVRLENVEELEFEGFKRFRFGEIERVTEAGWAATRFRVMLPTALLNARGEGDMNTRQLPMGRGVNVREGVREERE